MPATATDASSVSSTRSFLIFPPFWHVPDSRLTTNRWLAYPTPIASNRNVDRSVQAKRARPRRACGRATWPLAHQNLAEPTRVRLATCRGTGALELAALFAPVQSFEGDAPWSSVSRERERDISPVLRGSATRETPLKDWGSSGVGAASLGCAGGGVGGTDFPRPTTPACVMTVPRPEPVPLDHSSSMSV